MVLDAEKEGVVNIFRKRRIEDGAFEFGNSVWYLGTGGQQRMQQHANTLGSHVQLCIQEPGTGYRGYIAYPTWPEALDGMKSLKGNQRHVFELLPQGRRVKPYLDIDLEGGLPTDTTKEQVMGKLEEMIRKIFKQDYNKTLQPRDFIWMESPQASKFSMHLVISTHQPQLVYDNNGKKDQGAGHLAMRLLDNEDEPAAKWVDRAVYTSNRLMRMVGSSKATKRDSVLKLVNPDAALSDSIITWLDPVQEVIEVPGRVPLLLRMKKKLACPRDISYTKPHLTEDYTKTRMLELLAEKVHPTAFWDPTHGQEDAKDPALGVKFNYHDRSERCFTGCVHDGSQNLACWVDDREDIYARCFSDHCCHQSINLGHLYDDPEHHLAMAVRIEMRYLEASKPDADGQMTMHDSLRRNDSSKKFDHTLERWLKRDFHVLNLKSPMDTGKTTLIEGLLRRSFEGKSVLMVTYRRTLSQSLASRFGDLGFVSYMDVNPEVLSDRQAYPRVICQMDSLPYLSSFDGELPVYDLIILDEVESLLCHFSASTFTRPIMKSKMLLEMLRHASRGVITMDALWGVATWQFLNKGGLTQQLIHNVYKPPTRTFLFTNNEADWTASIIEDLTKGRNVVVCSLSIIHLDRLRVAVVESEVLAEDEMLIYTSMSDSSMTDTLNNVQQAWSVRLLMYSPSIEAGVDYNLPHFHKMYCYICLHSTSPHGLYQMTGRVRQLESLDIRCCAASGVSLRTTDRTKRKVTAEETMGFIQWAECELREKVPVEDSRLEGAGVRIGPGTTPMNYVLSHNLSKKLNAESNFIGALGELLNQEGHVVRIENVEKTAVRLMDPDDINLHVRNLLEAPDVEEWEFNEMDKHRCANTATSMEKKICTKHMYKASWGIDRVDEGFIKDNGYYAGSQKLSVMMRILYPWLKLKEYATALDNCPLLIVPLVNQVMDALGFAHPFDYEHVIEDYAPYMDRLMDTDMFKKYKTNVRLFDKRAVGNKVWTTKSITDSIRLVLGAAGLKFTSTSSRKRKDRVLQRSYTYKLDEAETLKQAELVKLKSRHFNRETTNEPAQKFLADLPFTRYQHLINVDSKGCVDLEYDM